MSVPFFINTMSHLFQNDVKFGTISYPCKFGAWMNYSVHPCSSLCPRFPAGVFTWKDSNVQVKSLAK